MQVRAAQGILTGPCSPGANSPQGRKDTEGCKEPLAWDEGGERPSSWVGVSQDPNADLEGSRGGPETLAPFREHCRLWLGPLPTDQRPHPVQSQRASLLETGGTGNFPKIRPSNGGRLCPGSPLLQLGVVSPIRHQPCFLGQGPVPDIWSAHCSASWPGAGAESCLSIQREAMALQKDLAGHALASSPCTR